MLLTGSPARAGTENPHRTPSPLPRGWGGRPLLHSGDDEVLTVLLPRQGDRLAQAGEVLDHTFPLHPRRNSPSVVTRTVARPNSTPSTEATTACAPSPSRFQLNKRPKPLSVSPHTAAVSSRSVPYAAPCRPRAPIAISTSSASHTQPEITPIPLWKECGPGFSSTPTPACPARFSPRGASPSIITKFCWLCCHTTVTVSPPWGSPPPRRCR